MEKTLSDFIKERQIWVAQEKVILIGCPDCTSYWDTVGFFRDERIGWRWVEKDPESRTIQLVSLLSEESDSLWG